MALQGFMLNTYDSSMMEEADLCSLSGDMMNCFSLAVCMISQLATCQLTSGGVCSSV